MVAEKKYILTADVAEKKILRMAYEILENNSGEKGLILAGIQENGSVVANNINRLLQETADIKTEVITITLDKKNPGEITLSKKLDFEDKVIILIDDVCSSGKTLLYALKPFLNYHPKKIQTLVLVERSRKFYPVNIDYTGLSIATTQHEHIYVEVSGDKVTGAYIA